MNVQARSLGASVPELQLDCPLVLIGGGKGGVGKSTVATNLGVALARRGVRVLLFDCDFALGNLDVLLGVEPQHRVDDALLGNELLADCVIGARPNLDLLPAASGSRALAQPDSGRRASLLRELGHLSARYDLIIGDAAAGIGPDVLTLGALADYSLLVTSPEPTALTDAYGVLKALHTLGLEELAEVVTPELFVNMARSVDEADATAARLTTVADRFLSRRPRMVGWLPRSRDVERAVQARRPFVEAAPAGPAASALSRLVDRVERLAKRRAAEALEA